MSAKATLHRMICASGSYPTFAPSLNSLPDALQLSFAYNRKNGRLSIADNAHEVAA